MRLEYALKGHVMSKEEQKSKRYIVFANQIGTRCELVEYQEPGEEVASSDDYLSPIGLVYDHPHNVYGDRVAANLVGKPLTGNPQISDLVGKLLTIADAMFVDPEQRKAFKSLLQQTVYGYANDKETEVVQTYQSARAKQQ